MNSHPKLIPQTFSSFAQMLRLIDLISIFWFQIVFTFHSRILHTLNLLNLLCMFYCCNYILNCHNTSQHCYKSLSITMYEDQVLYVFIFASNLVKCESFFVFLCTLLAVQWYMHTSRWKVQISYYFWNNRISERLKNYKLANIKINGILRKQKAFLVRCSWT